MTYWVLRERETGRLLATARRNSMTHVEFGDAGPPRLFTRRSAATNALASWRMGHWRLTGDEDGYYAEPSMAGYNKAIAERRQAIEVDIVEAELVLR